MIDANLIVKVILCGSSYTHEDQEKPTESHLRHKHHEQRSSINNSAWVNFSAVKEIPPVLLNSKAL